jgi:UDP-N-acetylglucosamine 4,6-dehydratase/5-epimerase
MLIEKLNEKFMFDNKTLLITGGTGSFGNLVLSRCLNSGLKEIRVFSRDEKKQDDMRRQFNDSRIKFYIGDVRDFNSISGATVGVDYIYHAAALKQVPSCEFYPIEAVKTNILGTENVLNAAINSNVKKVICLSTDKAVYPINAMGMSKALMEKVLIAKSREGENETVICGTRYGNVMSSRGSVIPLFVEQVLNKKEITITNPEMTRFMMTLDESVDLVMYAFEHGNPGDIFVQKAPATTINILAKAITELLGYKDYPISIIGTRHGEKKYETLLSEEEIVNAEDLGDYYRVSPDMRDLNYSIYYEEGEEGISSSQSYTSDNTKQLDLDETKIMLKKLKFIQQVVSGTLLEDPEII